MSSRRSRSGGNVERHDVEAIEEILTKRCPPRRAASRSRLVAAIRRKSTRTGRVPPTRSNSRSCSARSSLACSVERQLADLVEEKRAAVGQLRSCRCFTPMAPVNAPFSWPKSSLSSRVSVSAAQLMATNGLSARGTVPVHGARDQFLAGAALATDQHRRVRACDARDAVEERTHWFARADHVVLEVDLGAQLFVAFLEAKALTPLFTSDGGKRAKDHQQPEVTFVKRRPGPALEPHAADNATESHHAARQSRERHCRWHRRRRRRMPFARGPRGR